MKFYADYIHFRTEDFLDDSSFREWIARPTPEMNAYWQGLLQNHPHLNESFDQARVLALGLESSWTTFSDSYTDELYERIRPPTAIPFHRRPWFRFGMAAALLLVGLGTGFYFLTEKSYRTGYGELRQIELYDGSRVTLNANSLLKLPSRYQWSIRREVWLDGEAYFSVRKEILNDGAGPNRADGPLYRKFTVHTHRVDVGVLGTRFNVYTRPRKTQVVLDEGRIELSEVSARPSVLMQAGQVIEYSAGAPTVAVKRPVPVQTRRTVTWREELLLFNEASMEELEKRFSETYGLRLDLRADIFADQQFTGQLPVNDLSKALRILSETFDCRAVVEGKHVYFRADEKPALPNEN